MKILNLLKSVIFIIILCSLFFVVQYIFKPGWFYPSDNEDHGGRIQEYNQLNEESVDVLYNGTSHVMYGIMPMQLYKERRIVSYCGALSAQRMAPMYYQLMEEFKTQSPKVVMLDVSPLYLNYFQDSPWRRVLDSVYGFSKEKLEAAYQYTEEYIKDQKEQKEKEEEKEKSRLVVEDGKLTEVTESESDLADGDVAENAKEEEAADDEDEDMDTGNVLESYRETVNEFNKKFMIELGAVLPFFNYHSRWVSLNQYDFSKEPQYACYGKGYVCGTMTSRAYATKDTVNQTVLDITEEAVFPEYQYWGDSRKIKASETALYEEIPDEEQLKWLYKIKDLCDRNGVQLLLMKIPVLSTIRDYESSWTKMRSKKIHEIANEMGIGFCDMVYDYNLGIDSTTDYRDNGMHLNHYGATKVTRFLGNYLENVCGVKGGSDSYYNKSMPMYEKIGKIAELHSYSTGKKYFSYLEKNYVGKTIFLAVHGVQGGAFSKKQQNLLKVLGMQTAYTGTFGEQSYIGILRDGKSIYEATGVLPVQAEIEFEEDHQVALYSAGVSDNSIKYPQASIKIDGVEYALNGRGLNIVIYDNALHTVIDRINFYKTDAESKLIGERNYSKIDGDLKLYAHKLYQHFYENIMS